MDKRLLSASVNASMPESGSIRSICDRNLLRLLSQRPVPNGSKKSGSAQCELPNLPCGGQILPVLPLRLSATRSRVKRTIAR